MPVSEEYIEFVLDQLGGLGPVFHKRMFGGVGLYFEDLFFGLIANDILYFKVDDSNRERYIAARASPFCPYGEDDYSMSYYEVPADILEDHEAVTQWAREAVKAAERKSSGKAATGASEKKKSKSKQRLNRRSRSTTKTGRPNGQ